MACHLQRSAQAARHFLAPIGASTQVLEFVDKEQPATLGDHFGFGVNPHQIDVQKSGADESGKAFEKAFKKITSKGKKGISFGD